MSVIPNEVKNLLIRQKARCFTIVQNDVVFTSPPLRYGSKNCYCTTISKRTLMFAFAAAEYSSLGAASTTAG